MIAFVCRLRVLVLLVSLAAVTTLRAEGESAGGEPLVQDTEVDGVQVELKSAKRGSGGTVTIQFKFVNNGSKSVSYYSKVGLSSTDNPIEHVYFIDAENKKKYLIVKDSEGNPLGTKLNMLSLDAGASKAAWAKFPSPPDETKVISVYIPGAPPFEDVPLAE